MSAVDRRVPPATVASAPGAEAEKLLQRFGQLESSNRSRLLSLALDMIEKQRDARLPPRDRKAKQLIERIERCLELIAAADNPQALGPRIWRDMVATDRAELTALGIGYFGACRP